MPVLQIERASDRYINLSLAKIHLLFRVYDKSLKGSTDVKCMVPGNPFASLFRDVKIRINGLEVSHCSSAYPHISEFLFLTRIPKTYRDIVTVSGRVFQDYQDTRLQQLPAGAAAPSVLPVSPLQNYSSITKEGWKDLTKRYELFTINATNYVDISTYLFTDITNGGMSPLVLPPNCTVEIELHPNLPSKALLLSKIGELEPTIEISKASITLPRITPASSVPRSLTHQFLKIDAQPIIVPANSTNYRGLVTFAGSLPTRINLVFTNMKSFDGDYSQNLYASTPREIESIAFQVAGVYYPVPPIYANIEQNLVSDLYIRTAEALRHSLNNAKTTLPSIKKYVTDQFIFSVDISPDYSAGSTWQTNKESGAISMELKFSKPTEDQFIVMVLSESIATLRVGNSGEITLNDD